MVLTVCFRKGRCGKRPYLVRGEVGEGGKGAGGPVAADNLGDGEKRTPVVGQAIESAGRQNRVAGGQGAVIVFGPASEFAGKDLFKLGVLSVEAAAELTGLGWNQGNQDGAVVECGRELTDAGQHDWGKGFEGANGTRPFAAVRASVPFVTGVKETAQFVGLVEISVHLIEQENGLFLVHDAEQDGG